jgi:hypothetical protein
MYRCFLSTTDALNFSVSATCVWVTTSADLRQHRLIRGGDGTGCLSAAKTAENLLMKRIFF